LLEGSGKSLEMLFYTGKVTRHPAMENPTVVVLTDRNDLDDQLFDEVFAQAKVGAPLPESPVQAESRDHLKQLLQAREGGGIVFSTIQKFGLSQVDKHAGRPFPLLSERQNVVVMVDEAHRSNYDFVDGFARHLRDGLPNATYIGFTGTPIESADRSTRQVFGDYIDIYDLTQAVTDGATVKVFYEPRLAKVELPAEAHETLDYAFAEATSGTEEEARERLKTRWARVEAIVGSDKRIGELAADIVQHWEQRREVLAGKGMIVAMSRRIAVALYNEIVRLRPDWHSDDPAKGRIKVVITGSAADDALLQPHIYPKETLRQIKSRAKDPGDPLELVIVRDMWLTGFDSPAMHTMYVDKPMRGAPLMQAIARVK
jgi:type I restriction enzyme, R subunit